MNLKGTRFTDTDFKGKRALITGAGSGIGQQLAIQLAKQGAYCYLVDVDESGMQETQRFIQANDKTDKCDIFVVDVANFEAMEKIAQTVHEQTPALDYLFNNAGIGIGGPFLDTSIDQWQRIININVMGVVHGCKLFTPQMKAQGRGNIVNTASLAGLLAPQDMSAYAATKFAVVGLSESLSKELEPHGICVTTVCPGVVNTNITKSTELTGKLASRRKEIVKLYEKRNYSAEKTATVILDGVKRNANLLPVTPESWFMYSMKRLSPGLAKTIEKLANPMK